FIRRLQTGSTLNQLFQFSSDMLGRQSHFLLVAAFHRKQRDPREGWIAQLFAKFDFLVIKANEVVAARILDGGVKRGERLHENLALDIAPASTTRDLREQLERPLARAEIGK